MIEDTLVSLVRALVVAFSAVGFGRLVAPVLRSNSGNSVGPLILLALCVLPLFAPALLTGYAYAKWSLPLIHYPWARELVYVVLLVARFAPVGALLLWAFPPALGDAGRHCLALAQRSSGQRISFPVRLRMFADSSGVVFMVALLLAFHEFEIASLLSVDTWTVRLFDAHAGGLPWSDAIREASAPIIVQLSFAGGCGWVLYRHLNRGEVTSMISGSRRNGPGAWAVAGFSASVIVLVPVAIVVVDAVSGMQQLVSSFAMRRELAFSSLFGVSGGVLAAAIGGALPLRLLGMASLAGLCGALILAMGAVGLFQLPVLNAAYDSPLPLLVVLVVLLFPVVFLLQVLVRRQRSSPAAHVATDARSWRPLWLLRGRPMCAATLILCLLSYGELTASAILAPPGMTTASARLYNLMHYGQTQVLSALVMVVFLAPLILAGLVWGAIELGVRCRLANGA